MMLAEFESQDLYEP